MSTYLNVKWGGKLEVWLKLSEKKITLPGECLGQVDRARPGSVIFFSDLIYLLVFQALLYQAPLREN